METEWYEYREPDGKQKLYFCKRCKRGCAKMIFRRVVESEGVHKEYKVRCPHCEQEGTLHWSRALAEHSWNGRNGY